MPWTPDKEWDGQDAYIIGGGSSLRTFDFDLLRGKNTIGCNDAFRKGEEIVKYCIFGDASWWHLYKWDLKSFTNPVVTCAPSLMRLPGINVKQMTRVKEALGTGSGLAWNYSTGAAAINLAISLGARNIYLLGIDLCLVDNKSHWHDLRRGRTRDNVFERFVKGFQTAASGLCRFPDVKVYHVNEGVSKLPFFHQVAYREFVKELAQPQEMMA